MKQVFKVDDMHCANCAMRIEEIEDELPGIRKVAASYARMELRIDYDESRVTEAELIDAVRSKGYTATPA